MDVREASERDIKGIVEVHMTSFPNHFLTHLGHRFLSLLYRQILRENGGVCLVATREDQQIVGFVVGVKNQHELYRRLAKRKWPEFAIAALPAAIGQPRIIPRLMRALTYKNGGPPASCPALLMSLAVKPETQGTGLGKALVRGFLALMARTGERRVCLTTDRYNNDSVNSFYLKMGFKVSREFQTPEGRCMNEYMIETSVPDAFVGADHFQRGSLDLQGLLATPRVAIGNQDQNDKQSDRRTGNAEVFSEWLQRQGYHVLRTASTYWFDTVPHVYQAFPYHWLVSPTESEVKGVLENKFGIALRYSSPLSPTGGPPSFHVVCSEKAYDLHMLHRTSRQKTVKGLNSCTIAPISFEQLAYDGWKMRVETYHRHRIWLNTTKKRWMRTCLCAKDLEGFEAWGAFVNGRMEASIMAARIDDCFLLLHQQSYTDNLRLGVNNALTFTVTKELLQRPGVNLVHYGVRSLTAPLSVEEYKLRMGYSMQPVQQQVVLHPWLRPLLKARMLRFMYRLSHAIPASSTLAKAEAMLKIHSESKSAQQSPENPELVVQDTKVADQ